MPLPQRLWFPAVIATCLATSLSLSAQAAPGDTELVSRSLDGPAAGSSSGQQHSAALSADGRFVAFVSAASNLVPDDTNGTADVFVRDRLNDTTERVSVTSDGSERKGRAYDVGISGDGRFVVFTSD